jgi:hypothetical protein
VSFAPRLLLAAAVCAAVAAGAGCSRQIGDACTVPADCQPNGSRPCDLSQPGGYCTILGCDETTCPEEATCVRQFPAKYLTKSCDPTQPSTCDADEICLDSGVCARRETERRFCALVCSSNDDCRSGYECRRTGLKGSMVLSATVGASTAFCAPYTPPE